MTDEERASAYVLGTLDASERDQCGRRIVEDIGFAALVTAWENRLAPSSGHGVTSVVMGNCGVGFAPCKPDQRDMLVKLMEGVEDVPEVVMTKGLPWNWETFPQYLDALDARQFDIDVAAQIPHSALTNRPPVHAMEDWSPTNRDREKPRFYNQPGLDT